MLSISRLTYMSLWWRISSFVRGVLWPRCLSEGCRRLATQQDALSRHLLDRWCINRRDSAWVVISVKLYQKIKSARVAEWRRWENKGSLHVCGGAVSKLRPVSHGCREFPTLHHMRAIGGLRLVLLPTHHFLHLRFHLPITLQHATTRAGEHRTATMNL